MRAFVHCDICLMCGKCFEALMAMDAPYAARVLRCSVTRSATKQMRNVSAKYYRSMTRSSLHPKTGRVQDVSFEVGHQVWVPVKVKQSVMNMSAKIVAFGRNVKGAARCYFAGWLVAPVLTSFHLSWQVSPLRSNPLRRPSAVGSP